MARLHSATGVVLLGFVGFHLWETASATGGRERFVTRMTGLEGSAMAVLLEVALVLVPLVLHGVLGVVRAVRHRGERHAGYPDAGSRMLQGLTGAVVLVFIGVHLTHTWALKWRGSGHFAAYEALRTDLSQGVYLGLYVVGLTALCVHLAQGLGAAAETWSLARTHRARRAWRLAAGALAAGLWLVAINTTSHFATGDSLLFQVAPMIPAEGGVSEP
jgi:succinate dehydrogenase / fumarate reductase, cytochrome b subunit